MPAVGFLRLPFLQAALAFDDHDHDEHDHSYGRDPDYGGCLSFLEGLGGVCAEIAEPGTQPSRVLCALDVPQSRAASLEKK